MSEKTEVEYAKFERNPYSINMYQITEKKPCVLLMLICCGGFQLKLLCFNSYLYAADVMNGWPLMPQSNPNGLYQTVLTKFIKCATRLFFLPAAKL